MIVSANDIFNPFDTNRCRTFPLRGFKWLLLGVFVFLGSLSHLFHVSSAHVDMFSGFFWVHPQFLWVSLIFFRIFTPWPNTHRNDEKIVKTCERFFSNICLHKVLYEAYHLLDYIIKFFVF